MTLFNLAHPVGQGQLSRPWGQDQGHSSKINKKRGWCCLILEGNLVLFIAALNVTGFMLIIVIIKLCHDMLEIISMSLFLCCKF